jgi:hypothetical protein
MAIVMWHMTKTTEKTHKYARKDEGTKLAGNWKNDLLRKYMDNIVSKQASMRV